MIETTSDILARAKSYVDADDVNAGAWLDDTLWYEWMNQEYRNLYRALIRNGLMGPKFVDENITANGSDFYTLATDPLGVAGVAQMVNGSYPRPLAQMQVARGRYPWSNQNQTIAGSATHWQAHINPDGTICIGLSPSPGATMDNLYVVRMIPSPLTLVATVTDPTTQSAQVYFPHGTEDRMALGMAQRAYSREGVSSPSLNALVIQADAEMGRAAAELLTDQAPKARNVDYEFRGWRRRGQDLSPVMWTASPNLWWWAP